MFVKSAMNNILGLDISSTSVKLLELSGSGVACRVESYGLEPLPDNAVVEKNISDVEGVGEAIQRLVQRCKPKSKATAVAVAGSAVITRSILMPAGLNEDEMEIQIQLEAEQHIPYPLEEVALDYAVQGASSQSEDQVEVLIAVCRREHVEMRETALEIGGLKASVVDIEAHCIQRAVELVPDLLTKTSGEGVIGIVDIGAAMTTLSVLTSSGVPYTREQLFGGRQLAEAIQHRYSLSCAEALRAERQGELPDDYETEVLQPFREEVVQQVTRALTYFHNSITCDQVDQIILAGGTSSVEGLSEMVAKGVGVPCTIANPFINLPLASRVNRADLHKDAPAMMIACGLALRSFD